MIGGSAVIRPFEKRDRERLHEIRNAAFASVFQSFREIVGPDIAAIALANDEVEQGRHLDRLCDGGEVYIAEVDGEIAGFVAVQLDRLKKLGELGLNAVDPAFTGRGVGSQMYDFALERMRSEGMEAAVVGTGGDPSHAPARRAYEKAGFDRVIPSQHMYRRL